ncbi:MAG: hypothetical protein ACR2IJ_07245 [Fluviibacter sp.]
MLQGSLWCDVVQSAVQTFAPKFTASVSVETPLLYWTSPIQAGVSLVPQSTNTFDLGSSALRWANIYATTLNAPNAALTTVNSDQLTVYNVDAVTLGAQLFTTNINPSTTEVLKLGETGRVWYSAAIKNISADALTTNTLTTASLASTTATLSGALQTATLRVTGISQLDGALTALGGASISGTTNCSIVFASSVGATGSVSAGTLSSAGNCFVSGNLNCTGVSSSLIPATTATYNLGSSSNYWSNLYASALNAATLAAVTSVSTPIIKAISGNLGLGSSLIPSGSVTIGLTGTRFSKAWLDSLSVTNDTTTGTLAVGGQLTVGGTLGVAGTTTLSSLLNAPSIIVSGTGTIASVVSNTVTTTDFNAANITASGETNLNAKLWLGKVWEANYGIWAKGSGGIDTAIFKVDFTSDYGTTTIKSPNGTPSIALGTNGSIIRLDASRIIMGSIYLDPFNKAYARYHTDGQGLPAGTWAAFSTINWTTTDEARSLSGVFSLNSLDTTQIKNKSSGTLLLHVSYWVNWTFSISASRIAKLVRVSDQVGYAPTTCTVSAGVGSGVHSGHASILLGAGDSVALVVATDTVVPDNVSHAEICVALG